MAVHSAECYTCHRIIIAKNEIVECDVCGTVVEVGEPTSREKTDI